jgi:hypothetical protein
MECNCGCEIFEVEKTCMFLSGLEIKHSILTMDEAPWGSPA